MNWLYRLRIVLISTAALILILMAMSFSVMRAMLPHATGYQEDIKNAMETAIGLPVSMEAIDADMKWFTPRLKILDLIIFKDDGKTPLIELDEANFALAYIDSIRYRKPMIGGIELVGAELNIVRDKKDQITVQGVEIGKTGNANDTENDLARILKSISFSLLDSEIHWHDRTRKTDDMRFKEVDIKVESFLGEYGLDAQFRLPERYGKRAKITTKFTGDILRPATLKGQLYVSGNLLKMKPWTDLFSLPFHAAGDIDANIWVDFNRNQIDRIAAQVRGESVALQDKQLFPWRAEDIDLSLLYRRLSNGWRIDIDELMINKQRSLWRHPSEMILKVTNDKDVDLAISYLRLEDAVPLVRQFHEIEKISAIKQFALTKFKGELFNTHIEVEDKELVQLDSDFENLSLRSKTERVSFSGLDGHVSFADARTVLNLDSERFTLKMNDAFRSPIDMDLFQGKFIISVSGDDYSIVSKDISAQNSQLKLNSRFRLENVSGNTSLDMQVDFRDVDTKDIGDYYPVNMLSENLVEWLDGSLSGGRVDSGRFVFRGRVDQFPFKKADGVMEVGFSVDDLDIDYLDGWPALRGLKADLLFYNEELFIENGTAVVLDNKVNDLRAHIPDLDYPVLYVSGRTATDADRLQEFVWKSPLDEVLGDALRGFSLKGNTEYLFDLKSKLYGENEVSTKGKLLFDNVELNYPTMKYDLHHIDGVLDFTENSLSADGIKAKIGNDVIGIDIVTEESALIRESIFKITGKIEVDALLKRFEWLPKDWLSGKSGWEINLHVPLSKSDHLARVEATSDLAGVVVDISDVMKKDVSMGLPINLKTYIYEDKMSLDVVSADKFKVSAKRDNKDVWNVDVRSKIINGELIFDQQLSTDSSVLMALDDMDLDAFASRRSEKKTESINPNIIPSLKVKSKKLAWDDWQFEDVSLSTTWHPQGMVIDSLKLTGPAMSAKAHGSWLYTWQQQQETSISLEINSSDFGSTLSQLGIFKDLRRATMTSSSNWFWKAEPFRISWDKIIGKSTAHLKDGEMKDIDPGAGGRLVGLLNVLHLPERLILNFDDVYKDGFVFEEVKAEFDLNDGVARSDRIDITAAAANMVMAGDVGLQDKTYDLKVLVKPNSSAATFTGGAIAGGPVLGASLVLLQKLLGIDKAAYDQYTIKGPWEKPVIDQISKRVSSAPEE